MFLILAQLQSIFYLGEAPIKISYFDFFLFVLDLEILLHLIKSKLEIKGLTVFGHCYFYSAYGDDTTFFSQHTFSLKNMVDTFIFFILFLTQTKLKKTLNSRYWSLEIGSRSSLWHKLYISKLYIETLGTYLSYDEKLKEEKKIIRL